MYSIIMIRMSIEIYTIIFDKKPKLDMKSTYNLTRGGLGKHGSV